MLKTISAAEAQRLMQNTRQTGPVVEPMCIAKPSVNPVSAEMDFSDGESATLLGLNKTERRYYDILQGRERRGELTKLRVQAVTLRLADSTRYTPDFSGFVNGRLKFFEVKGSYIHEDGWLKLKMAAAMFPEFDFVKAQWDKGQWTETEIKK